MKHFDLKSVRFFCKILYLKQYINLPGFKFSRKNLSNLSKSKMYSLLKCRCGLEMTNFLFIFTSFYPIFIYEIIEYLNLCTC